MLKEQLAFDKHYYHKLSILRIIHALCTMSTYYFVHCVVNVTCYKVRCVIKFRLDKLLKNRGWSAYRLAKESGIHPSVLSKYLHNQVREISLETLNAMCRALSCRAGDLIEYKHDKVPPPK